MLRYLTIIFVTLLSLNCASQSQNDDDITTYYFIRHAEKDRSDTTEKNPHLTDAGRKRADQWSSILQHIQFDAVYATDYYRTKETAQPTADNNSLTITLYNTQTYFDDAFKLATKGKTVLVVGHSNTTPEFVNAILGTETYEHIDDANNGNLYIVTISNEQPRASVLTIN